MSKPSYEQREAKCRNCGKQITVVVPLAGIYASERNRQWLIKERTKNCVHCYKEKSNENDRIDQN